MKVNLLPRLLAAILLFNSALAIEETVEREWTSVKGTKITAKATDLTDRDMVTLETDEGKTINIHLRKLSKDDQEFLRLFFRAERDEIDEEEIEDDEDLDDDDDRDDGFEKLTFSPGELTGPVKATPSTSYYIYQPEEFQKDIKASVMIWTQNNGGKADTLRHLVEAADLAGMVLIVPVEAKKEKEVTLINNLAHANDALRHAKVKLPLNGDAVHYGGNDSGAAAAFWNSLKMNSVGTFTISGFFTPDMTGNNPGHHFMAGGAMDYNRYLTAWAAAKFGDRGVHYIHPGGHVFPNRDTVTLGMMWMYTQGLYGGKASRSKEAEEFEKRFLPWITDLADTSEGEAIFLTEMLVKRCSLSGEFKTEIEKLHNALLEKEGAKAHLEGLEALANFSRRQYTKHGNLYHPKRNHTMKKWERMAERMEKKYEKAEELQKIFREISHPTVP